MSNWKSATLGQVIIEGNGLLQTGPFGSQLHASDYVVNGIPCIMPSNLKENRINLSGIARISDKDAQRLSQHLVKAGDIVYSRRGDITQKALISESEDGFFCGTGCILIRLGNSVNSKFITYFLSTKESKEWLINNAVGITMANLNTKILGKLPLKLPPRNYQDKIAAVFSALDSKIELNNCINSELEAMAKTLYDYWFVQFDFPDKDGKPYKTSGGKMVWNEELKREIPDGWEVEEIGKYADVRKGDLITEKEAEIGFIKVVAGGVNFSYTHSKANRDKNTITISGSGANAGFINFWREPIFASDCITVRGNTDTETLLLLEHLKFIQCHILRQSTGSAQPHVYPSDIKILFYAVPPNFLIDDFGKLVCPINDKIAINIKENQTLSELRDWLLPMLMNGQVTVN
jgi:type I restriction enzyme, S subunit